MEQWRWKPDWGRFKKKYFHPLLWKIRSTRTRIQITASPFLSPVLTSSLNFILIFQLLLNVSTWVSRLNIYKTEFLISSHQISLSFFSSVSVIISLLVLVFTPKDLESSLTLVFFSCSLSSPSFASTPVCPECDHFSSSPLLAQWSKHCHLLAELLRKKILTGLSASFFPSLQSVHQLASNVIILKYK